MFHTQLMGPTKTVEDLLLLMFKDKERRMFQRLQVIAVAKHSEKRYLACIK